MQPNHEQFAARRLSEYSLSIQFELSVDAEMSLGRPIEVFGYTSGAMVLKVAKSRELTDLHNRLNEELRGRFDSCPVAYDGDAYTFHMPIVIGGKSFEDYEKTLKFLDKREFNIDAVFDQLGLLYYDDDSIKPGT